MEPITAHVIEAVRNEKCRLISSRVPFFQKSSGWSRIAKTAGLHDAIRSALTLSGIWSSDRLCLRLIIVDRQTERPNSGVGFDGSGKRTIHQDCIRSGPSAEEACQGSQRVRFTGSELCSDRSTALEQQEWRQGQQRLWKREPSCAPKSS